MSDTVLGSRLNQKTALIIFILLIALIPYRLYTLKVEAAVSSSWELEDFDYRKEFNLTEGEHFDIDYQVNITVVKGDGTDSAYIVYLGSNVQDDFDDVRFTWYNATDETEYEIPHAITELNSGENATFWIKVPEVYGKRGDYPNNPIYGDGDIPWGGLNPNSFTILRDPIDGTAIQYNGVYWGAYHTDAGENAIGLANSSDLINWVDIGYVILNENDTDAEAWENGTNPGGSTVVPTEFIYMGDESGVGYDFWLFYNALDFVDTDRKRVGVAYSSDMVTFTRDLAANPVLDWLPTHVGNVRGVEDFRFQKMSNGSWAGVYEADQTDTAGSALGTTICLGTYPNGTWLDRGQIFSALDAGADAMTNPAVIRTDSGGVTYYEIYYEWLDRTPSQDARTWGANVTEDQFFDLNGPNKTLDRNPLINHGSDWEGALAVSNHLIRKSNGRIWLYYVGHQTDDKQIGYADVASLIGAEEVYDSTLYIYYGNTTITGASDPTNTFISFEDFESSSDGDGLPIGDLSVVSQNWVIEVDDVRGYNGSMSLLFDDDGAGNNYARLQDQDPELDDADEGGIRYYFALYGTDSAGADSWDVSIHNEGAVSVVSLNREDSDDMLEYYDGGGWVDISIIDEDVWNTYEIGVELNDSTFDLKLNGTWYRDLTCRNPVDSIDSLLIWGAGNAPVATLWYDYIFSGKYMYPEPGFGSWGSEETNPDGADETPSITSFIISDLSDGVTLFKTLWYRPVMVVRDQTGLSDIGTSYFSFETDYGWHNVSYNYQTDVFAVEEGGGRIIIADGYTESSGNSLTIHFYLMCLEPIDVKNNIDVYCRVTDVSSGDSDWSLEQSNYFNIEDYVADEPSGSSGWTPSEVPAEEPQEIWVDSDGDGIPNWDDDDIDGDWVPNEYDPDMDGDDILNEDDPDPYIPEEEEKKPILFSFKTPTGAIINIINPMYYLKPYQEIILPFIFLLLILLLYAIYKSRQNEEKNKGRIAPNIRKDGYDKLGELLKRK